MASSEQGHGQRPRNAELFYIVPLLLGGNPSDLGNQTILTREQHIQAVRYWNRVILQLRETGDAGQ